MINVEIYISLKKTVVDPQGLTVKHALDSLGYKNLSEVRVGKFITLKLNSKDKKDAEKKVSQMCHKLLANPIIEDYHFKIEEEKK